ncbi:PREDICTED: 70 kDa peptidyl-prolyl isomerase-like [Trachymyrmex cornetzi]|uniref:Peptidyl-prolyl cis-trans isomerase FKBP4 n=1 Tax=Trachymyrmex cornetzi TaxID=471704 RepID=A0A151J954_9HYME|nr:PREDICTED: 70 kDa peptidyl-prolyl isomerase-like [Trachymyrmex cornetzi]XP_018360838.1 PREDICTED: 70 kDa peptidyl-prolyl isomerase-like [Trachymyrmex cornetzi]XP_018360839.1 PREDICTED: 70 kDa peptidyl-prolyl isomerase-like [Trachymyrmex cornetzi]KYN21564.1 Peptidyl-prolyl cis-trans isomerase FKBP4 [Trachymyrmex cornetzi]
MSHLWKSADKSIQKRVLKSDVFTKKPTECSTCTIIVENINVTGMSETDLKEKYHTNILDGESEKTVVIGEASSEIDEKIERVICMMNINEKSLVTIAMPIKQSDESVDNNESVKFEITLALCKRHKSVWEWSAEEKYQVALRYKERGTELFKEFRIIDAFRKFSKACKLLITLEPIADLKLDKQLEYNINNLRLALYNNMAICQLKRKNYQHVVTLCTKVLNKDENNVKALYRRGVAYGNMGDNEKATTDLKAVLTLESTNHLAKEQFDVFNTRLQESFQRNKDMMRRMFKTY